ncbi:MAG: hypothetical protein KME64_20935 [Scytonematopsis contorta HA4267-MV1]|jgi:hypothetical protein|nr:hypothetical protein [Scytonematopsis contorta HA4267-MV1]
MDIQLTTTEINSAREVLQDYEPAQHALENLQRHSGNVKRSFQDLWIEKNSPSPITQERESLWEVTLRVLREELCGDEGFRGQLSDYTKNPGSSPLLTGLIVSLVGIAGTQGLPLDPAIATVVVLYILKIGLNIFCEYTEPVDNP